MRNRHCGADQFAKLLAARTPMDRLLPEICAAAAYAVIPIAGLLQPAAAGGTVSAGSVWAYLVGGAMLAIMPAAEASVWIPAERERGTLDALIMTRTDRTTLVWAVYRQLLLRWARLVVWLIPLFAICLVSRPKPNSWLWDAGVTELLMTIRSAEDQPVRLALWLLSLENFWWRGPRYFPMILLVRAVCDISGLLLTTALAMRLGASCKSRHAALMLSMLLVPLVVIFITGPLRGLVTVWWVPLSLAAEFLAAVYAVRSTARRFDALVLKDASPD